LVVNQAEAAVAAATRTTIKQLGYAEKRLDSAHRRHIHAIGALATLRRLLPREIEAKVMAGDPEIQAPSPVAGDGPIDEPVQSEATSGNTAEGEAILTFEPTHLPERRRRRRSGGAAKRGSGL